MAVRDTSRDGWKNKVERWLLTHLHPLWNFLNQSQWLGSKVNSFLIGRAVMKAKPRPHQYSTISGFTSWDSLTDRSWSGRHLPERTVEGLPDIEAVLSLFKAPSGSKQAESKKSTYLFASFAQWFTDGFLMTDTKNRRKNYSNHQIDLNPLYGLNNAQTNALRLKSSEGSARGRLKSEIIAGEEYAPTLFIPGTLDKKPEFAALNPPLGTEGAIPSAKTDTLFAFGGDRANSTVITAAINTLFLREHNRVAGMIERAHPAWDDERIFQTARNVMIVLLIKIVVEDYINHISPYLFKFRADPRAVLRAVWNRPNWIALEFNLLYRWHGFVPDTFGIAGKALPIREVIRDNSLLKHHGLGAMLHHASFQKAGALSLFNTTEKLWEVEKASIAQGRSNGLASYNDYRAAVGFPRVDRFEQITGDERVVAGLKRIYGNVDKIEFFTGLFAEETSGNAAIPALIGRMVALDAFSQALTNPLLSENVFNTETFTREGMETITSTCRLSDLVSRNIADSQGILTSFDQVT